MHDITVKFLRQCGYKVGVYHHRQKSATKDALAKGGITRIIIDSPNKEHFEGTAVCCRSDNYNKKLGVRIAIGRSGVKHHLSYHENKQRDHSI